MFASMLRPYPQAPPTFLFPLLWFLMLYHTARDHKERQSVHSKVEGMSELGQTRAA